MYDPLDRDIPKQEEWELYEIDKPWNVKSNELLQNIDGLSGIKGSHLSIPMKNSLHEKLNYLLESGKESCVQIAHEYIKLAKDQGSEDDNLILAYNPLIKAYEKQLKFFE